MFNYKFEIQSIIGSRGSNHYQFEYPRGLCFAGNFLFICDWLNKRIEKYSCGLLYKDSIKLDYNPIQIKIINKTVCMRNDKSSIYFYDLDTFQLKYAYESTHSGSICSIDKYFYEYCNASNKLFCYNEQGSLIHELDGLDLKMNKWANISYFNNSFIVFPESSPNLYLF